MLGLLFAASGCDSPPSHLPIPKPELPVVSFEGYNIPKFPTAQGQLNYARSFFSDINEQKAALRMVCRLFPGAGTACGTADLTLAYMHLGNDYRFAPRTAMLRAIDAYRGIIQSYPDHPKILVKAHWYLGWIFCDLLGEAGEGLAYFRRITSDWPGLPMALSPPVPWVSLVFPAGPAAPPADEAKPRKQWGALALLEIIRHTPDRREAFQAFDRLMGAYKTDTATAMAARLMLSDPLTAGAVRPRLDELLALGTVNPFQARDLRQLAGAE